MQNPSMSERGRLFRVRISLGREGKRWLVIESREPGKVERQAEAMARRLWPGWRRIYSVGKPIEMPWPATDVTSREFLGKAYDTVTNPPSR